MSRLYGGDTIGRTGTNDFALHAKQELDHALIISRQIDYLGKMPIATPKPVKTSEKAEEMLRSDLANETETIRNYRERVQQCEQLGEYAMAEQIRQILVTSRTIRSIWRRRWGKKCRLRKRQR